MSRHGLYRIAAIDSTATLAELARLFLRGVGRKHDFARVEAERRKQADPELVR
jgi:hypothetical protein